MREEKSKLDYYKEKIIDSSNPNELIDIIYSLKADNNLIDEQKKNTEINAYIRLEKVLDEKLDENITSKIIVDFFLSNSLKDDENSSEFQSFNRRKLSEWLDKLSPSSRQSVRSQVIDTCLQSLISQNPKPACWIISSLGFRNEEIVDNLWNLVLLNDKDEGDAAISSLSWLGIPNNWKRRVLAELHDRMKKRYNNSLLWSVARFKDPSSIPVVFDYWLSQSRTDESVDSSLAFTAIREIIDDKDTDNGLQNMVWNKCAEIVERNPKKEYWNLDIGHVVISCNSNLVIPTLFKWHSDNVDWFENPGWARYLLMDRLEKMIKPRQLEGWYVDDSDKIFEYLREDACLDTQLDGFVPNQERLVKKAAWDTLLRAGNKAVLLWFSEAVEKEQSRFMKQDIMNRLACFTHNPLPISVINWITESYDDEGSGGDGREISFRMAAVRMAQSTGNKEALQVLLDFGFTYKNSVLSQSAEAVAEVVLYLIRNGDRKLVSDLLGQLKGEENANKRLVLANAVELIASEYPDLLEPQVQVLFEIIMDEDRSEIERGQVLSAISFLEQYKLPANLFVVLEKWANYPDRWLGLGSLKVLASYGHLELLPDIMTSVLGLKYKNGEWQTVSETRSSEWTAHIIGLLYSKKPRKYKSAVVSILENKGWEPVVQVLHWLHVAHVTNKVETPGEVIDALFTRIRKKQSSIYSEMELLEISASIAPTKFLNEPWVDLLDNWMPDGRSALANILGKVDLDSESQRLCITTLEVLAGDRLYAVRRAAYRALAKQSKSYLLNLCNVWAESNIIEFNNRAAEAGGWIEDKSYFNKGEDEFKNLYDQLSTHNERQVREAAVRSLQERRKRIWARTYLANILRVNKGTNDEIFMNWKYGDALTQIGDDDTLAELASRLDEKSLPPNVRHWLRRIFEGTEKSWKKTTQSWPEPWIDMKGAIETGKGKLIVSRQDEILISYTVWKNPSSVPLEKSEWGGIIVSSFENFINVDYAEIVLENNRRGRIILTGYWGDTASFVGESNYPEEVLNG